jgi:hypothetical protein
VSQMLALMHCFAFFPFFFLLCLFMCCGAEKWCWGGGSKSTKEDKKKICWSGKQACYAMAMKRGGVKG